MSSPYDAPTDDEVEMTASKKLKSQPPDVVVAVGSGESKQEFECYKVILSFASDYFDTMLSTNMKEGELGRINFPEKDPEEWKQFYQFISPSNVGVLKIASDVLVLLPWFHEFQMKAHVAECDRCLHECRAQSSWNGKLDDEFGEVLGILQLADRYQLKSTKELVGGQISELMKCSAAAYLFNLQTIKSLVAMILPLKLNETKIRMSGEDGCKNLWPAFEEIVSPHLSSLTQDIVDDPTSFPVLVYSFKQIKEEREKAKSEVEKAEETSRTIKESATRVINTVVNEYPQRLYDYLPSRRVMGTTGACNINQYGRELLKTIVRKHFIGEHKKDFERLGIEAPSA